MIGTVSNVPLQPPDEEHTRRLDAGAVTFGVEYRDVVPDGLSATLAASDEGVSIHVCGTDDGFEYLRFDVFDDAPHYHYIHRPADGGGEIVNQIVDFDTTAHGDMLAWAIERLRTRLPVMLEEAGGGHLVERLDPALLGPAIERVETLASEAQRARRAS